MIVSDIRKLKFFGRSRTGIELLPIDKKTSETDNDVLQYIKPFKTRSSSVASCSSRSSRSDKLLGKCCSINIHPTSSKSTDSVTIFVKPRNASIDCEKVDNITECTKQLNLESVESSTASQNNGTAGKSPLYYRVLEFLFCGPFDSANNRQLLTSFGISYILDLMGKKELYQVTSVTTSKGTKPISLLSVKIDSENTIQAMLNKFQIINHFIAEARSKGASVILCNKDGEDVCQAIALQYIMFYHKIPLKNALNYIENVEERTTVDLSSKVYLALKAWEVELSEKWNREKRVFGNKRSSTSYDGERIKPNRNSRSSYSGFSTSFCTQSKDITS